jgi:hypothetical protein
MKLLFYPANIVSHFLTARLPMNVTHSPDRPHTHDEVAARNDERQLADKMTLY